MRLRLRTVAGASAEIEVEVEFPLSVVRTQAASALGLNDDEPLLVLRGRRLGAAEDACTLPELGLSDGSLLVVVAGGRPQAATTAATAAASGVAMSEASSAGGGASSAQQQPVAGVDAAAHDAEVARQLQQEEDESTARRVQELQDGDLAREEQMRQAAGDQRAADVASTPSLCFVRGDLPSCGGHQWVPLMVDTGAQMSVMTSSLADRFGLMPRLDRSAAGVAGGVGHARILGRLRGVVVRFGELDLEVDFSVMDGSQMPSQNLAILGLDQLAAHHMVVDLDSRVLRIGGVEGYPVRFLDRYEVPDEFRLDGGPRNCSVQ